LPYKFQYNDFFKERAGRLGVGKGVTWHRKLVFYAVLSPLNGL
jgi:hypothetical protein